MIVGSTVFNPGDLRTAVTLQRRSVTSNAGGYPSANWVDVADLMVRWVNVHGSEAWSASAAQNAPGVMAAQAATVMMRYRSDVDVTCCLLKGSERYEIVSLDNIHDENVLIELKVQKMRAG